MQLVCAAQTVVAIYLYNCNSGDIILMNICITFKYLSVYQPYHIFLLNSHLVDIIYRPTICCQAVFIYWNSSYYSHKVKRNHHRCSGGGIVTFNRECGFLMRNKINKINDKPIFGHNMRENNILTSNGTVWCNLFFFSIFSRSEMKIIIKSHIFEGVLVQPRPPVGSTRVWGWTNTLRDFF